MSKPKSMGAPADFDAPPRGASAASAAVLFKGCNFVDNYVTTVIEKSKIDRRTVGKRSGLEDLCA